MSKQRDGHKGKDTVIYDGSCPMCQAVMTHIQASSQADAVRPVDFRTQAPPVPLKAEAMEHEIHVVGADGKVYAGAEAIVHILSTYPRWAWLAALAKLPPVMWVLRLGYRWVAANRFFLFGDAARLFWTKAITSVGLVAGMLLSWKLWAGPRSYPSVPVIEVLSSVPASVSAVLAVFVACASVFALAWPRPRGPLVMLIVPLVLLALLDQSRWQPWAYQYLVTLAVLAAFSWRKEDAKGAGRALAALRFLVAMTYVYSGLEKMTPGLLANVGPFLIGPRHASWILVAPFVELGIGIALLGRRTRAVGVLGAALMHILILVLLGPWGAAYNSVVWPWNIVMLLLVPVLFRRSSDDILHPLTQRGAGWAQGLVLLLYGLLPALGLLGWWDSYLSVSLYTGNIAGARIVLDGVAYGRLPPDIKRQANGTPEGAIISFYAWSMSELNVPPYPEPRVFKAIARDVCREMGDEGLYLDIKDRILATGGGEERRYGCRELEGKE